MPDVFVQFWQFLTNNKDPLDTLLKIIACLVAPLGGLLTAIVSAIVWLIRRWWLSRLRGDVSAFEFITDSATLLPKLYGRENDNSPLSDPNIPYQPRDPKRDIQAELRQKLSDGRYLLITGRSGLGKTREAGVLVQNLMNEGYRVVRVVKSGWLDRPKQFPPELKDVSRRLIILLDDLNNLFSTGDIAQSPKAEQMPLMGSASYHDRLLSVLDYFEAACGPAEIRVIATARDEADYWQKLNFSLSDALWKRFARFELGELTQDATANLITTSAARAGLEIRADDIPAIARQNDGTFMNVVINLKRLQAENKPVTVETYAQTLYGSWEQVYERAVKQHVAVRFIYDAIDLLRQVDIEPYIWLVEPVAKQLWGGNLIQKFIQGGRINIALDFLIENTKMIGRNDQLLIPHDGQIEAKGTSLKWEDHIEWLLPLILKEINTGNQTNAAYHYTRGNIFYRFNRFDDAVVVYRTSLALDPHNASVNLALGNSLYALKQYSVAANAYRKALDINSQYVAAYYNLGIVLYELERFTEAEDAYRQAISLDPNHAEAHNNLGLLLHQKKNYFEAEQAYRHAILDNPSDAKAHYNLGNLLNTLERFPEAEDAYKKATILDPNDPKAFQNFGRFLHSLKRYEEAERAYLTVRLLSPDDARTLYNLANLYRESERYKEAEETYRILITAAPDNADAYYSLGTLLYKLKRFDEAEPFIRKAIVIAPNDEDCYFVLAHLLRYKTQNRERDAIIAYEKLVELNPQDSDTYLALACLYKQLGKNETFSSYATTARKLIAVDDWYSLACLESICGDVNTAFDALRKAVPTDDFDAAWAWRDPDLQWIRDDPRFRDLIGEPPVNAP